MRFVALLGVVVAWLSALGFTIVLPRRAPVRKNPPVRSSFLLALVITAVLTLALASRAFGWRLPAWASAALWWGIAGALAYQLLALLVARRRGARDRRHINLGPSRRTGERRHHS